MTGKDLTGDTLHVRPQDATRAAAARYLTRKGHDDLLPILGLAELPGPEPEPEGDEPMPAQPDENIDGIADLLDAADHTGNAALGRAAEKIRALIRELQDQLAEHARDTRLRQEMAELEARLAEIREQLAAKPAQYSSAA